MTNNTNKLDNTLHNKINGNNNGRKRTTIKKHGYKKNFSHVISDLNAITKADSNTVVADVKRLLAAKDNGDTSEHLKSEIIRLYHVIVDGYLQDAVIEGCGKGSLLKILRMGRKLRDVENPKDRINKGKSKSVLAKEDKDKKGLNDGLRDKWLKWFKKKKYEYIIPFDRDLYQAINNAAYKVNFVMLNNNSKSDTQFYQKGLAHCFVIVDIKQYPKQERKYSLKGSPYITRKEWGSAYKPARG